MSIKDIMAEIEFNNKAIAMNNAWGHLYPKAGKTYRGFFIFTYTAWSEMTLIDSDFRDLEASPFLYYSMIDFIKNLSDKNSIKEGNVYMFDGELKMFKNGNSRFYGKIKKIKIDKHIKV